MDASALTKKIDRRNAAIIAAIVAIVLLLLLKRRGGGNTIVNRNGNGLNMPGLGDFSWNVGDINIPGITIPDLSVYDQQSSCGCSLATIELPDAGPVYYAPAKVNRNAPTLVHYTTMVVAPPKPSRPRMSGGTAV